MARSRNRRGVAAALVTAALLAVPAPGARAARTDPTLALTSAQLILGQSTNTLRFEGSVLGLDLVQHALPLQLMVYGPAGEYLRFDVTAGAFTGESASLVDGLGSAEAVSLLASGTPQSDSGLLHVGPGRIDVRIPASFSAAGPLVAVAFLLDAGEVVLSNTVAVAVLGGAQ